MYMKTDRSNTKTRSWIPCIFMIFLILVVSPFPAASSPGEVWTIIAPPESLGDAAVQAAVDDLQKLGTGYGISFPIHSEPAGTRANTIMLGNSARNPYTKSLLDQGNVTLKEVENPEGFAIATRPLGEGRQMIVSGGSAQGIAYGLYWIGDRLRVYKSMTDINV